MIPTLQRAVTSFYNLIYEAQTSPPPVADRPARGALRWANRGAELGP